MTICDEIHAHREAAMVEDVAEADCGHLTPAMYGFRSYVSMPIVLPDGEFFGTLHAIDPKPARLKDPATVGMFRLFAELIAFHVDGIRRTDAAEALLIDERRIAELPEQFVAVLGHDLRNPIASIDVGARMLAKGTLDERSRRIVGLIQGAVHRMNGLVDNVMDFAGGRLDGEYRTRGARPRT